MEEYKAILIVKMSSLGDVIHSLPTLAAIRHNWPDAKIVWAIHESFSGVLPGKPWVDEVVYIDKKKLTSLSYLNHLHKELQAYHFDIAIDLQGLMKSSLITLLSGAKRRVSYWEAREGSRFINEPLVGPNKYGHVIERYLDVVRCLGGVVRDIEFPMVALDEAKKSVHEKLLQEGYQDRPYAILTPATRWAPKDWPVERYAEIGDKLVQEGYEVVLLGGPSDAEMGQELVSLMKEKSINMMGKTTLHEMMALIRHTSLFISGDTGPLHMANAMKVPLIALYGPTYPGRLGPYGNERAKVIVSPTSKATMEQMKTDDKETMKDITVEMVWNAVEDMLGKKGSSI